MTTEIVKGEKVMTTAMVKGYEEITTATVNSERRKSNDCRGCEKHTSNDYAAVNNYRDSSNGWHSGPISFKPEKNLEFFSG